MRFTLLCLLLLLVGCPDTVDPNDPCGLGTSADSAAFDESFASMTVVRSSDGVTPDEADGRGPVFAAADTVAAFADATAGVDVVYCVHTRDGASDLVGSEEASLSAGESTTDLGEFGAGDYVVRVGQGDTLIANLPFGVD